LYPSKHNTTPAIMENLPEDIMLAIIKKVSAFGDELDA